MTTARQFLRFCLVGAVNTAVNFGVFAGLLVAKAYYLLASTTGFLAGVIVSYALNRRWAFACRRQGNVTEASRFLLVNLLALGANMTTMYLSVGHLGIPVTAAWCVAIVVSLQVNFFGSKLWVFRRDVL